MSINQRKNNGGRAGRHTSLVRSNLIAYAAFQVARYALPILLTPALARALPLGEFGSYAILLSCAWTASVAMEFGFYLFGITSISSTAPADLGRAVSSITSAKILLLPVTLAVYFSLSWASGVVQNNPIAGLFGALCAVGYGASFAWYFQGRQRARAAVIIEATPQIAQLLVILMAGKLAHSLNFVMLIQALVPISSVSISLYIVFRTLRIHLSVVDGIYSMKMAFPFFVERFFFTLYTATSPAIVGILANAQEAAYYSIGDKVGIFMGSLIIPISQTMLPVLSQLSWRDAQFWRVATKTLRYAAALALVAAVVLILVMQPAITLVFPKAYLNAVPAARLAAVGGVFGCLATAIANFIVIPGKRARAMVWSASFAFATSLLCQVLLVPSAGAVGAAVGRACANATSCLILALVAYDLYRRFLAKEQIESADAERA